LFEDASGNVALGTTTIAGRFNSLDSAKHQGQFSGWSELGGAAASNGEFRVGDNTGFQGRVHYTSGDLYFDNTAVGFGDIFFRIATSGTPITMLSLLGTGAVQFGRQLQVSDPGQAAMIVSGWANKSGASAINGEFRLGSSTAYQGRISEDGGILYIENTHDSVNGDIRLRVRTNGTPVEGIILKDSGNVGLGTTSPVCRLDVAGGPIRKRTSYTVATLPAASLGDGMETYVTDSNATLAAGHGDVVAGGGSNYVPVYSRGGQWRIG
jgi:hypothetical protein